MSHILIVSEVGPTLREIYIWHCQNNFNHSDSVRCRFHVVWDLPLTRHPNISTFSPHSYNITQCWCSVGPLFVTLAQHRISSRSAYCVCCNSINIQIAMLFVKYVNIYIATRQMRYAPWVSIYVCPLMQFVIFRFIDFVYCCLSISVPSLNKAFNII